MSDDALPTATTRPRAIVVAACIDVLLVIVFVSLGRTTHDEPGNAVSGALRVAAPFLIGLALGWVIAGGWRQPVSIRTGLVIWPVTVVVGMVLRRTLFDRGTAVSFVVVATLVTGVFLVGWRALASVLARRNHALVGAQEP